MTLHIYDAGNSDFVKGLNTVLKPFGTGAFHCGVEVYGLEWSFSDTSCFEDDDISGIFYNRPKCAEGHHYLESLQLGSTKVSEIEVIDIIEKLEENWPGEAYDVFERNCCHFCAEFCKNLGVSNPPDWVTCLAARGAIVYKGMQGLKRSKQKLAEATGASCLSGRVCCDVDEGTAEVIDVIPSLQEAERQGRELVRL